MLVNQSEIQTILIYDENTIVVCAVNKNYVMSWNLSKNISTKKCNNNINRMGKGSSEILLNTNDETIKSYAFGVKHKMLRTM